VFQPLRHPLAVVALHHQRRAFDGAPTTQAFQPRLVVLKDFTCRSWMASTLRALRRQGVTIPIIALTAAQAAQEELKGQMT
jgi:hypothetical protein